MTTSTFSTEVPIFFHYLFLCPLLGLTFLTLTLNLKTLWTGALPAVRLCSFSTQ
jgi:hypothetical protein